MAATERPAEDGAGARPGGFGPTEFSASFEGASRTLWCIAAAILGDRVGADDVLQEAALIALRKLDEFDPNAPGTSFTAWMASIVRYVALNDARQRKRRRACALPPERTMMPGHQVRDGAGPGGPEPFDTRVADALEALGETARVCLLLRTVREMTYSEIAATLDIPQGTAMSHVHRARRALRDRLATHADMPKESPCD